MSSVAQALQKSKGGGILTALGEIAVSIGGYYLLRAFGVGVLWALTVPAIVVAVLTVIVTFRRRRIDLIGLLVLIEVVTTIVLSLATQDPRIAALREAAYIFVAGVFCLVTLVYRTPLTHMSTYSVASFGDPKREKAFDHAWRHVSRYRAWQRLLTASLGLILVAAAIIKADIVYSAAQGQIAHAVDVSNIITFVMIALLVVVSVVLIQPPRKIIEKLTEQT